MSHASAAFLEHLGRVAVTRGDYAGFEFILDALEKEPNDDPKAPQVLPSANVTVNGRLEKDGDVDVFAVEPADSPAHAAR